MRQQALPQSWDYDSLSLIDREGLPHYKLTKQAFIEPFAHDPHAHLKPIWKVLPGDESDWVMHKIREALGGDPSYSSRSVELEGHRLDGRLRFFDLGKGLVACLVKTWWNTDSQPAPPPMKCDELSRYYQSKQRMDLSDPEFVWWVQDTGWITNHRSHLEIAPLCNLSHGRLRHVEEVFDTEAAECLMSQIHIALQTQQNQSFILEETIANFRMVNAYIVYPLTHSSLTQGEVVMVAKKFIASTNLESQKISSAG